MLEGGEGVGKSTQWRRLTWLMQQAGVDVVAIREPGGTPVGNTLRQLLLDPDGSLAVPTEALLFAASRAQLVTDVIAPARERGAVVIADRFLLSTYAYQGAGRGLDLGILSVVNRLATGNVTPDLTMLLTLPVTAALSRMRERGAADRMESESPAFHARVHDAFAAATSDAWRVKHPEIGVVDAIDADGTEDDVTARCVAALARHWPERFGALETFIDA